MISELHEMNKYSYFKKKLYRKHPNINLKTPGGPRTTHWEPLFKG